MDRRPDKLYYYTTTYTMYSILTAGTFWATNILYMNDAEEFVNGLREIEDIINAKPSKEEQNDPFQYKFDITDPHIYTISFCTNEDLLSQWCIYARESGVNLELDFRYLNSSGNTYKFFCARNSNKDRELQVKAPLHEVIYFTRKAMPKKEQIEEAEAQIVKLMIKFKLAKRNGKEHLQIPDGQLSKVGDVASLIKRFEFSAEREWRLVFNLGQYAYSQPPLTFYREQDHILKPFIKVSPSKKNKTGSRSKPWPITAITVGPGYNQDRVFTSLRYFLNYGNYIRTFSDEKLIDAVELYLDKVLKKCSLLTTQKDTLGNKIEYLKKKMKTVPLSPNILQQLSYNLRDTLTAEFPECEKIMQGIELTRGGITLQKSDIPYIY